MEIIGMSSNFAVERTRSKNAEVTNWSLADDSASSLSGAFSEMKWQARTGLLDRKTAVRAQVESLCATRLAKATGDAFTLKRQCHRDDSSVSTEPQFCNNHGISFLNLDD